MLAVDAIQKELRATDLLARLGGDEFGLLLPETDIENAVKIVERIRLGIGALEPRFAGKQYGFTVSIGVSAWQPDESAIAPALARADRALYEAKENGRDRVVAIA